MKTNEAIAIVGMACVFPDAPDLESFWENILEGKDSIRPIPGDRNIDNSWPGAIKSDQIVCTHGGFLKNHQPFSPIEYGIMPKVCEKVDPEQLLILQTVDRAFKDAGLDIEKIDLRYTNTILGRGGYLGNSLQQLHLRTEVIIQVLSLLKDLHPEIKEASLIKIRNELRSCFDHLQPEIIPFGVPNIGTGRVANRFNMMGANYTIDAACASALLATEAAVMALRNGKCNRAVTGGLFFANNPSFWWVFSMLGALSSSNHIRPFSANADGMLVGEGIGVLILERLDDAIADGRRIYAVIKGTGSSSDGRGNALLAPRKEGQMECLLKAYEDAGVSPETISLVEGHGTGTLTGDQVELDTLREFYGPDSEGVPIRALGSVKSMIGHTMPAAGAAGMIKTALALYHKILPLTLHAENPSKKLEGSSFYLNARTRPWIHPASKPRRAGINSFGFGGINGHVIMEEVESTGSQLTDLAVKWPSELFVLGSDSHKGLLNTIKIIQKDLEISLELDSPFGLLSYTVCTNWQRGKQYNISLIAKDKDDLKLKLAHVKRCLKNQDLQEIGQLSDIYYEPTPLARNGKVCFLFPGNAFPGLGDDYTDRLAELCLFFPCFRAWFDSLDQGRPDDEIRPYPYSSMLFTPSDFDRDLFVALKKELRQLDNSVDGVFISNAASLDIMSEIGLKPDMVTGTSLGEWSALMAGGVIDFKNAASLNVHKVKLDEEDVNGALGLAQCSIEKLQPVIERVKELGMGPVSCSLDLSPLQVVYGGERKAVEEVTMRLKQEDIWSEHLNLIPIHTPLCAPVARIQHKLLRNLEISPQKVPVYSGSTAGIYPEDPEAARSLLADNTIMTVKMRDLFERLYKDNARIFIQLGGGGKVLGPLEETLKDRPLLAMALDVPNRHPVNQLQHLVSKLIAHGLSLDLDLFFRYRHSYLKTKLHPKVKQSKLMMPLEMVVPQLKIKIPIDGFKLADQDISNSLSTKEPAEIKMSTQERILAKQLKIGHQIMTLQMKENLSDSAMLLDLIKQQQELFLGLNNGAPPQTQLENDPGTNNWRLPFIDEIEEHLPGKKIRIKRILSLEEDLFFKDHAFIPLPDDIKPAEERFPALPMAVALEIMAETGQALFPGMKVVGFCDIKNKQWINLGDDCPSLTLTVKAEVQKPMDSPALPVYVHCSLENELTTDKPYVTGTVLLNKEFNDYDSNSASLKPDLGHTNPCQLNPRELYQPQALYHGPCFQGLAELQKAGQGGIMGLLQVPPVKAFFKNKDARGMILAPGVIDAASQLIACWAWEVQDEDIWVAPISIRDIQVFQDHPQAYDKIKSWLIMRKFGERLIEFDLLLEKDNCPYMLITGWQDWRMKWPKDFLKLWKSPSENLLSKKIDFGTLLDHPGSFFEMEAFHVKTANFLGVSTDWVARLYLNSREWHQWKELGQKMQMPWLLGRIAAKDAVRKLLSRIHGVVLYPSQIDIRNHNSGFPYIILPNGVSISPQISIAHKSRDAVAVAILNQDAPVGIDMEELGDGISSKLQDHIFTHDELLSEGLKDLSDDWIMRAWCAKEAMAKALDMGAIFNPKLYRIMTINRENGIIQLEYKNKQGSLSTNHPLALVKTIIEEQKVFAFCQML